MPFTFTKTKIPGVILVEAKIFPDSRGEFMETFKLHEFKAAGINFNFVQDNFSRSRRGVVRGLHFQKPPHEQGKLVIAIKGRILDVAVDIRKTSPTFGKWIAEELSEHNRRFLFIPPGFAHGFMALEDDTRVIYKMTNNEYAQESDAGVRYDDPDLNIPWPIKNVIVSEKDAKLPFLKEAEVFE